MPASFNIRKLTNPTDEELDKGAKTLAESFHYMIFRDALLDDPTLVQALMRAHITTAVYGGEVYYAESSSGDVLGVAVWFGPKQLFRDTEGQRQAGWNQLMERLDQKSQDWWKYFNDLYNDAAEKAFGAGAKVAAYHLQMFGVIPERHRQGIGRALIEFVEAKAKAINVDLCLESLGPEDLVTHMIDLYGGMGFTLKGTDDFKACSGMDCKFAFLWKNTTKDA
ncbi:hypothetical protein PILCRDRAFT_825929 [Piloderma croceum F 1598]|uniref:N-acetyltransferase domain-containing protein n=1 Tax=Piloderma croceum (strain F 1598) TaxID=765440 RepID=A0A0C3ASL2_PILCF|nr:hypothetical protein PILCRDRAFT_825929 [Piloderma croceum F 1598]